MENSVYTGSTVLLVERLKLRAKIWLIYRV